MKNNTILSERQKQQIAELQQKQQSEMLAALIENNFPAEAIPGAFNSWLGYALIHEKQGNLQCDWPTLRSLFTKLKEKEVAHEYTLQQFGFSCNCIEDKTPNQLCVDAAEYITIQDTIQELATKWKEIVGALHEPIQKRYQELINQVRNNKPIIMPS